jgi:hypothetical protein
MTTTTKKPELLWSERGQTGCSLPGHAPYRGSDTWVWERWRKVTPREAAAFERELGRPIACECCEAIARRERADHDRP